MILNYFVFLSFQTKGTISKGAILKTLILLGENTFQ